MSQIPDFTGEEIRAIEDTLKEHYEHPVEPQCVDIDVHLYPDERELAGRPAAYREKDGCHIVLARTGDSQFDSQFFYGNREQFGTGKKYYHDLIDCLITAIGVQADDDLHRNKVKDFNQQFTMPAFMQALLFQSLHKTDTTVSS